MRTATPPFFRATIIVAAALCLPLVAGAGFAAPAEGAGWSSAESFFGPSTIKSSSSLFRSAVGSM